MPRHWHCNVGWGWPRHSQHPFSGWCIVGGNVAQVQGASCASVVSSTAASKWEGIFTHTPLGIRHACFKFIPDFEGPRFCNIGRYLGNMRCCEHSPPSLILCASSFGRCRGTSRVKRMQRFSANGLLCQPFWATNISACWVRISVMTMDDEKAEHAMFFNDFVRGIRGGVEVRLFAAIGLCESLPAVIWLAVHRGLQVLL